MKIAIPYKTNGRLVTGLEFKRPKGGLIADVRRIAEQSDPYSAILAFIAGSVSVLVTDDSDIEDPAAIKAAVRDMPYLCADWAAMQVLISAGADDQVDPFHQCSSCRKPFPAGWSDEEPVRIRDLPVSMAWDGEAAIVPVISVTLQYPVEYLDKKSGEALMTVESLEMHLPTLGDCIAAARKKGLEDSMDFQYATFLAAIDKVNGLEADKKWKAEQGDLLFGQMDIADIKAVAEATRKYGMKTSIERRCPSCHRQQTVEVPTQDFFASGLQGNN